MGVLRCVDGTLLGVTAVTCRDRAGHPYDITLELARNQRPFASIGQRCGYQLADLAFRVRSARQDPEQAATWPNPDDRFPDVPARHATRAPGPREPQVGPAEPGTTEPGARPPLRAFQAGESEYFTLRSRDRSDLPGSGELRCVLRSSADWMPHPHGWRLSRRAVLEAWNDRGTGVRAELTSAELVSFLDTVLGEPVGAAAGPVPLARATAGDRPGALSWPTWWQRGKVPDESAGSRLPALRAAARVVAVAVGSTPARWGDVRR